ncbi:SDR family oxidoreductase [Spirillospora sp. CA-294931]|uniref:SDR family oxidoreductase n=1 Tax=Spirillospora sp. CA-294931 TaxID=3240042 RepID=UPI003D8C219D
MKVLITGGASGLGAAIARRVAEDGGTPLVLDHDPPEDDVRFVQADLADRTCAERGAHTLARGAGGLNAVVTAAGIDASGPLDAVPARDWERVVQVNLLGTAAVVRACLHYLEHQPNGRIVTCACTHGLHGTADATARCAADGGVIGFSRALARELSGRIGVTTLVPGDAGPYRHEDVADSVAFALAQPSGSEVGELAVRPAREPARP